MKSLFIAKRRRALRETKFDGNGANTDDEKNCDVLDITGNIYQKYVKKDKGAGAGVDDDEGDLSDEECGSFSSNTSSTVGLPKHRGPHRVCI